MQKFFPKISMAAIVLLPLLLTGCVHMHMETDIAKDGSGTFTMTYSMSETVAQSLKELEELGMPGQQDMDDAPTFDDFKKEEIEKACKEHNVKLQKFEHTTVDGRESLEMVLAFKNPNDLADALATTMEEQGGMRLFKTTSGDYTLRMVEMPETEEDDEDDVEEDDDSQEMTQMDPEKMGKSMEIMGKLMDSLSELDVAMRITVPGEILEHNAQRVEGRTLIWEINSSNMMTMSDETDMEPDIVFSSEGVKIDAPLWSQ